jgi:hypothetical protein
MPRRPGVWLLSAKAIRLAMVLLTAVQIALSPSMTRGPIGEYFVGAGLDSSGKTNSCCGSIRCSG